MALIQVNFVSNTLRRTVPLQVILPVDRLTADGSTPAPKKFKTLYLLHGIFGNYTDWVSGTRIQRWAQKHDLAVVMPSGDNAFYVDRPETFNRYGEFIGRELVEITRNMFPLSHNREDTFIGGLSMGGYGALRNGLKYHETFGAIVSLSAATHFMDHPGVLYKQTDPVDRVFMDTVFGNLRKAARSDRNPNVLLKALAEKKAADPALSLPRVYVACGKEDDLLSCSRLYRDRFRRAGFEVKYSETPGGHDWDFWDQQIQRAIVWLCRPEAGDSRE
jgi:S-formylglutathione hydrolase FrmB